MVAERTGCIKLFTSATGLMVMIFHMSVVGEASHNINRELNCACLVSLCQAFAPVPGVCLRLMHGGLIRTFAEMYSLQRLASPRSSTQLCVALLYQEVTRYLHTSISISHCQTHSLSLPTTQSGIGLLCSAREAVLLLPAPCDTTSLAQRVVHKSLGCVQAVTSYAVNTFPLHT